MHSARTRYGRVVLSLALLGVLTTLSGCTSALATAIYLVKGNDIKADYDGLKHKKVAVVCRPLVALQYRDTHASKDLGAQVALMLRDRIPKAQIIESRKVDQWTDENMWDDFAEVGNAVGADIVVGIDLQSFSLYQGQTLYQGKADLQVTVVDCKDGDKVVYEKILPQMVYPPNSGVPTSERPERQFRREFILVLADYVGRHFYAHDAYSDYARDAQALR